MPHAGLFISKFSVSSASASPFFMLIQDHLSAFNLHVVLFSMYICAKLGVFFVAMDILSVYVWE